MQTRSSSKIKQKLMNAIRNGDVKTAKQMIGVAMDINFIFDRSTPLHAALESRSMDMLELLLSQPNIDLNISNEELEPPLLNILYIYNWKKPNREEFILRLIRAGCDINRSNVNGETPLHLCVKYGARGRTTIAHELLKQNADVNAQDYLCVTPLEYAVTARNLELVCMLLNYNADVYIKSKRNGHTPFSYALHLKCNEIAKVLSNYYSFLDDDVNYIFNEEEVCRVFLQCTNADLFKAAWAKLDLELISNNTGFLNNCLDHCSYSTSDWVECLYLILNSDIAFDLIDSMRDIFLYEFFISMWEHHVQSDDMIGLIYMVLRTGFELTITDINYAVMFYGLSQDLQPFMYSTYRSVTDIFIFFCPLHAFVIGMETDFTVEKISRLFHDAVMEWRVHCSYHYVNQCVLAEIFTITVAFFSFPADAKNSLMSLKGCHGHVIMDEERLQEIPEFPSLMELSRNQIHKYLVQTFKFQQPYQLQDFVKKLLIPNKIKDIILFKEPIY